MVIRKKEGPSGNLGAGVVFFSIIVLIVLTGTSINRIFFAKKDIEQKPAMIQTASPSPTPKENIKRIIIIIEDNSPTVNIRSKATIYSEIIKKVEKDNTFDVLEEEKEWFKIKLDEKTDGYVSKKYAKLVKDE